MQWNGKNINQIRDFMNIRAKVIDRKIRIVTLEGATYASEGDWVIRGVAGEFYPCKDEIFKATYEEVTNEEKII